MKKLIVSLLFVMLFFQGCSVYKSFVNVSRLKFKLDSVENFTVNGISVDGKSKLADFSTADIFRLSTIFTSGELPVRFNINVAAKNPNDGKGGYTSTDVKIKAFPWELFINGKKTISGDIERPVNIPGVGEATVIPLQIEMDLLEFFGDGGMNEVIQLALKLGGKEKSSSHIELFVKPVLGTSIGDLNYPERIKIVDYEFR